MRRRTKVTLHLHDKELWFTTAEAERLEREPRRSSDPRALPVLILKTDETPTEFRDRVNLALRRQRELHGARVRVEFERTDLR